MNQDQARFWWAVGIVSIIVLLIIAMAQVANAAEQECEGIWHPVDGCVTVEVYDEWFGAENLAQTPSLAFDGRSVADVYGHENDEIAPSERRSVFQGVVYPSFKEIVSESGFTFVAL